jgi:hypothetical protein
LDEILRAAAQTSAYLVQTFGIYGAIIFFGLWPTYVCVYLFAKHGWRISALRPMLITLVLALLSVILSGWLFVTGMALGMWG